MYKSIYSNIEPQIEDFFLQNYGWSVSLNSIESDKKIEKVCKEMGFTKMSECLNSFAQSGYPEKLPQIIAKEFSIGESYFFRDKKFFNTLEYRIIPEFIKEKSLYDRNINIWSVGCSSGEEAYSISIMLHRHIPDISNWNINIFATDINTDVLEKARNGIYTEYSFRDMPDVYKYIYFKKIDDKYEILELYKKNVHFIEHNIVHKTNPFSYQNIFFDLIILKNVLIYFNPQKGKEVVDYLYANLKPKGWLSTTPVEYSSPIFSSYRAMNFSSDGLIQKSISNNMTIEKAAERLSEISSQADNNFEAITIIQPYKHTQQDKIIFEDTPYNHYKKSCEMIESGEIKEAKKHLRKSLYLDNRFIVGLIALGSIYKNEADFENYRLYINRARHLLFEMQPSEIVEYSDNMTADELIRMIDAENILDKGFLDANIKRNS